MAAEPKRAAIREAGQSIPGYDEFEIDVEKVMRAELPAHLNSIEAAPLTREAIGLIPERAKGAYVLYDVDVAVYAGKTDAKHGFRQRLERHHFTLQHRKGFDISRMRFKAVRIMVFSNFDVEAILIDELRRLNAAALAWNNTGFGSNDPGHNRENEEPGEFDRNLPINIDMPLEGCPLGPGKHEALPAMLTLKKWLPYDFRFQVDAGPNGKPVHFSKGHADHRLPTSIVSIPDTPWTMRDFLLELLRVLPDGWRVTVFPGRVILYKEATTYPFALESFTK